MILEVANYKEVIFISSLIGEKKNRVSGEKEPAYYISIDSAKGVGSIQCSKDVFNYLSQIPKYSPVNIFMELDTWQRDFVVTNIVLAKKKD